MEALLRRHVWVVDLIGIAIGSALAGHAAATFIGAALPPSLSPPVRRSHPSSPPPLPSREKSIDAIVGRDVFCSLRGDPTPLERSRRELTLLAIMFAPPPADPRWSVAIIRNDDTATAGPYGVGARLGGATIDGIEDVRVVLDVGGGRREFLELLRGRARTEPDSRRSAGVAGGIRQLGAHSYEVRRTMLEQFPAGGMTPQLPRVVPRARNGQPTALQLFGIGRDGPFAALGLANGDLLLEVNGRPVVTPDDALAAYSTLRSADRVGLVIERGGQRIRMDYAIR